jgi:dolichol-phosphate mannosyltransferase
LRSIWRKKITATTIPAKSIVHRTWRFLVTTILILSVRGGITGSLIVWGAPEAFALITAISLGWVLAYIAIALQRYLDATSNSQVLYWTSAALGFIAYAIILRISYLGLLEAIPQEAYYWNYAMRLAPGYLDHPPMVAVLIRIGEWVFGHGEFGLRFASFTCGFALLGFVYLFAIRMVDRPTALVATALAAVLPYYFFASGMLVSPDASLAVAWIISLYFFHRALVGGEKKAWYGVGIGIGLGMLSKYTIALLGPAALVYMLIDRQSWRWFLRPEPYLAVLLSLVVFSPVIYWNATHDWASFQFQTQDRFLDIPEFSFHLLVGNIMAIATPLTLMVLPLLFINRWRNEQSTLGPAEQEKYPNRLFVACFVLVPLAVFAWNSLTNEPRLNWTGPIWLALLPTMAWTVARSADLRWSWLSKLLRKTAMPAITGLLVFYALTLHYLTLGIPDAGYPKGLARLLGWPQAAQQMAHIQQEIINDGGNASVIVGLDTYFIASKFSFYGTPEYLGRSNKQTSDDSSVTQLRATGHHLLGDKSLMFSYWDPAEEFSGQTMILVSRSPQDLSDAKVAQFFGHLSPEINPVPLIKSGFGNTEKKVNQYYYRIAYDYRPPKK